MHFYAKMGLQFKIAKNKKKPWNDLEMHVVSKFGVVAFLTLASDPLYYLAQGKGQK